MAINVTGPFMRSAACFWKSTSQLALGLAQPVLLLSSGPFTPTLRTRKPHGVGVGGGVLCLDIINLITIIHLFSVL